MSRASRLLDLLQALRGHRRPVTAARLAEEMGVSLRTIYRDIETLRAQGAAIEGEAGFGYVPKPGFTLPPLMFDDDELDALILGLRLVRERGDPELDEAAERTLVKIEAVLPEERGNEMASHGLRAGPLQGSDTAHLGIIRRALREETKLRLRYTDKKGEASARVVWPVAVAFFVGSEVLAAWCELRRGFRHFRLDRVQDVEALGERYPRRRRMLLAEWRAQENIENQRPLAAAGIWHCAALRNGGDPRERRPMSETGLLILYVNDPAASGRFLREVLGREPTEASPSFMMFRLPNWLRLGL